MANIIEALDAALRARYMPRAIRSAITTTRGLNARLNALQKQFPTQKALAAHLGIGPQAIRRWKAGTQKPSAATLRKIEGAHNRLVSLPEMRRRLKALPPPNSVVVAAQVNWNGYKNQARDGQRSVTLGGMKGVMVRTIRAWATAGPEAAADVFQRGTATVHNIPNSDDAPGIQFEGDDVTVSIPWENP
jgi:DNA-binding transcriptional regulator YdaS (Cro superfamily)